MFDNAERSELLAVVRAGLAQLAEMSTYADHKWANSRMPQEFCRLEEARERMERAEQLYAEVVRVLRK